MIAPMAKMKLEMIFIQRTESDPGFVILGDFSVDAESPASPHLLIGSIGDVQDVDLGRKKFSGRIVDKLITYSQKDTGRDSWDFVTRVIITLELTSGEPDPIFKELNETLKSNPPSAPSPGTLAAFQTLVR
jgi:hypothetical protein